MPIIFYTRTVAPIGFIMALTMVDFHRIHDISFISMYKTNIA